MNILILSSNHPYKISGIVAHDIYRGLKEIPGNYVRMVVKPYDKYSNLDFLPIQSDLQWNIFRLKCRFQNLFFKKKRQENPVIKNNTDYCILDGDQTINYYSSSRIIKRSRFKPDVVIILFMHQFLTFRNLYEINKLTNAPIYLYMMDMASITGGCHYAWDCNRFNESCGSCPGLFSDNPMDQSKINFEFKRRYINLTNITTIAGTQWQFNQLIQSKLFENKKKHKVLLSIDDELFKPGDKIKIRELLGIPIDKKIIFIGASYLDQKRKGWKELLNSFKILADNLSKEEKSLIHIAIAGNVNINGTTQLPFEYTVLGFLDQNDLPKVFQAADLFVCPSIEDSGPMMINQAIMSGTPVVSFKMGVALDLVHSGETGYCAELGNVNDLANGIKFVLNLGEKEYQTMSNNCRALGLQLCQTKNQAQKFMNIFTNNT
jgi:glycosyltransferase involved in cell wall biosynthesis